MADEEPKHEIISRKEAKKKGAKFYYTGVPCRKAGHMELRSVSTRSCVACNKENNQKWRAQNVERVRHRANVRARERYANEPKIREKVHLYYVQHADKLKAYASEYQKVHREKARVAFERYRITEKGRAVAKKYHVSRKGREADKRYYDTHREQLRERGCINSAKYRAKYPDKVKAAEQKWRAKNSERVNIYIRNRKARKMGNGGSHTKADIAEIRKLQKDRCAMPWCRASLHGKGHVDHIVPLAKGGRNDRCNIQLTCAHCNRKKSARDPIDHARSQGMLL